MSSLSFFIHSFSCSFLNHTFRLPLAARIGYQRDYRGKSPVTSVALHPNQGELFCTDEDGNLRVWDLAANACVTEVAPDGQTPLQSVTVASDASTVAAVSNLGTCFAWRLDPASTRGTTLEPVQRIAAHSTYALKCLFSPDARYLATTSADQTVKLWDLDNGFALAKTLVGHTAWVWSCAFSADSAYLVTASSDKTAKLWDLKNGEVILDYRGHSKALTSIALNDC